MDPVTFKVFTNNTHLVALKNTGNVFTYDTIERLNIKAKNWRDLVSEEEFSRKDIITLQDPQNVESRNLSTFKYLKEGADTASPEQQRERNDPSRNVNAAALGNGASILKPKKQGADINPDALASNKDSISRTLSAISSKSQTPSTTTTTTSTPSSKLKTPSTQAHALHTTGLAAASLTSTGLTPHTAADLATLSQETYLLHPRRVRQPGYILLSLSVPSPTTSSSPATTTKSLTLELLPEFAPRACYNFLSLAKAAYYDNTTFHRNIPSFMVQGGDPSGTGKGGRSHWNRNFDDEFDGPLKFDKRGVLAMANKGKNTNGSQFFLTYRACPHLLRKHTIFGRVVVDEAESVDALKALEAVETGVGEEGGRPKRAIRILEAKVLVDPFEEFLKDKEAREKVKAEREEVRKRGGAEDERVTWTGKRVRGDGKAEEEVAGGGGGGVGKYLKVGNGAGIEEGKGRVMEEWEGGEAEQPTKKKLKGGGGFGNFDIW